MKYLFPTLFTLSSASLLQGVDKKWGKFLSPDSQEVLKQGFGDEKALLEGILGARLRQINEYACWCYFDEYFGAGKGQPMDGLDESCKTMAEGYQCAMMDAEEEGMTCIPWEVDYTAADFLADDINQGCIQNNPGNKCAQRACSIEGSFIANMFSFFFSGGATNLSYLHANGFNPKDSCGVKVGTTPNFSEKSCCGNYPTRFVYKTLGGDRKCCGSRTYNAVTLKCCDSENSSVKFNC